MEKTIRLLYKKHQFHQCWDLTQWFHMLGSKSVAEAPVIPTIKHSMRSNTILILLSVSCFQKAQIQEFPIAGRFSYSES